MSDTVIEFPAPEPSVDWNSILIEVESIKTLQGYQESFASRAGYPPPVSEDLRGTIFDGAA